MSRQDFDFGGVQHYYFPHVTTLERILFVAPVLLFSVIAHEYAHGYAALKQGDSTAKQLGRLTWNPVKHIDPFLTIIMPLVLYVASGMALGGAKPVPVDPRNYRHLRRGDIIVSLAGVAANLVLAFVCALAIVLLGFIARVAPAAESVVGVLQVMMVIGVQLNLLLMVFNLLPIPPLDGSHVMKYLLPPAWAVQYQRIGFLGIVILILILNFTPGFLSWWFAPARFVAGRLLSSVRGMLTPATFSWLS